MTAMETVVVVDDNAAFRRQARALLEAGGLAVVGEAGTVADGIAVIEAVRPRVALVDIGLPDGDGFDVAAAASRSFESAEVAVILISSRGRSAYSVRLAASPATAFLSKDDLSAEAVRACLGVEGAPA